MFLKISQNSQENTCTRVSLAQVFSCEFCKIFKNTFFTEHFRVTASENLTTGSSHIPTVSAYHVEKLLRNIVSKKSSGMDKIPPKLMKISAKVFSKLLAIEINNSFIKGMFPDNAKIACVSPLDKHFHYEYSVTNFRPVSILNTFQKFMKQFLKIPSVLKISLLDFKMIEGMNWTTIML